MIPALRLVDETPLESGLSLPRPFRILLIKPYQPSSVLVYAPPLGLLYLAATLRERFGSQIEVTVLDMKVKRLLPEWLKDKLGTELCPDVVGVSALNCEAKSARNISDIVKGYSSDVITVLGGPYALHRSNELLMKTSFDWVFSGGADLTFPEVVYRHVKGEPLANDIQGFSYRKSDGALSISTSTHNIAELDALPFPAWDMVDFDAYAKEMSQMSMMKGQRYATIFTSRGCPYLCNYCHDIFTKKFTYRSPENVIAEIELLYEKYGVDEFQIVDDIFNLHKPRLKKIMSEVGRRWPGKLKFSFPNGLRGDILDEEVIDALAQAGTYAMAIAIETVTPRLQELVEKHLDFEKTRRAIEMADQRGIAVVGFFMVGFPTESVQEIKATVDYALKSKLTLANFFVVVPQPQTPLYDLAKIEDPAILEKYALDEEDGVSYRGGNPWYQRVYGFPLSQYVRFAHLRFYCSPRRLWRIATHVPPKSLLRGAKHLFRLLLLK